MSSRKATIIPALRYRDADKAVDWLCKAFGFERHFVVGEAGKLVYSQLTLPESEGHGMIMASPVREGHEFDKHQGPSAEKATQSSYLVVNDAHAHHDRAVAAGARVVVPLNDEHGGPMYSCLDLEGHLWSFGTYNPWDAPGAN